MTLASTHMGLYHPLFVFLRERQREEGNSILIFNFYPSSSSPRKKKSGSNFQRK